MMTLNLGKQGTNRAQIAAEYAVLIGLVVAAFIVMNTYIKRGMQAHLKDAVDLQLSRRFGETGFNPEYHQYEPEYYSRNAETVHNSRESEGMERDGVMRTSQTSSGLMVSEERIIDTH